MLSEVPSALLPVQQRFVDALSDGLDAHTFEHLPAGGVRVERDDDDELKLTVQPRDEGGCDIRAFVGNDHIKVFLGDAHEDFIQAADFECADGDFVDRAVIWFLDALRGRIEFTATYRGSDLLSTRYVRHGDDQTQYGAAGILTPARLRFWQSKRRVKHRPSWTGGS